MTNYTSPFLEVAGFNKQRFQKERVALHNLDDLLIETEALELAGVDVICKITAEFIQRITNLKMRVSVFPGSWYTMKGILRLCRSLDISVESS